jgi:hypothetical protein
MYAEMKINAFDIPYLADYMEVPNKKDMYVEITSRSMYCLSELKPKQSR